MLPRFSLVCLVAFLACCLLGSARPGLDLIVKAFSFGKSSDEPTSIDDSASLPDTPGAVEIVMASAKSSLGGTSLKPDVLPMRTTSRWPTPTNDAAYGQPLSMTIQISIDEGMHVKDGMLHSVRSGQGMMMIHDELVPVIITDLELGEGSFLVSPASSHAKHQFVRRQLVEPDSGGGGLIEVTLASQGKQKSIKTVIDACKPTSLSPEATVDLFPGIVTAVENSGTETAAPFPGAGGTFETTSVTAAPFPGS